MSRRGTFVWFARHELRLAWRDWLAMIAAGRRRRPQTLLLWLIVFVLFMHLLGYAMVARYAGIGLDGDKPVLVAVAGTILLSWSLMLSQAMESVTRAFYARADLDLILASPAPARTIFAVRIAAIALSTALTALLLAAPFIDALVFAGGARWFCAYAVVAAMGAAAAALAVALTVALFRSIGPRRTRLVAQIVAAVIGAAFVIGIQVAAIMSYGSLSRYAVLQSEWVAAHTPGPASVLWWPARALLGDWEALVAVVLASVALLALAILVFSPRFGDYAVAAAGVSQTQGARQRGRTAFRAMSPGRALRRKEWMLLRRDPWLVSQSLMQLLYLIPPALLLWHNFESPADGLVVLVPVLVMAAGQLAGGLAWLAASGEDAPDLIATAPATPGRIMRAKVEAVMGSVALVFLPLVAALALAFPYFAMVAGIGIAAASASATAIQLWFRAQAKRSQFRRRQTSSRLATFAEAFSSIAWAGTAALAAAGTGLALVTATGALLVLAGARLIRPKPATI